MPGTASAGPAIPMTDSTCLLPPSLEILLSPEPTDVDEKSIQIQLGRLFETDPTRCWIDIFSPRGHSAGQSKSLPPRTGEEDTDIQYVRIAFMTNARLRTPYRYLGRCNTPFQRARNVQQCKDLAERAKLGTFEVAEPSHLQPMLF
jgi:hypothetical protein